MSDLSGQKIAVNDHQTQLRKSLQVGEGSYRLANTER
jgi:hypothetical protein